MGWDIHFRNRFISSHRLIFQTQQRLKKDWIFRNRFSLTYRCFEQKFFNFESVARISDLSCCRNFWEHDGDPPTPKYPETRFQKIAWIIRSYKFLKICQNQHFSCFYHEISSKIDAGGWKNICNSAGRSRSTFWSAMGFYS